MDLVLRIRVILDGLLKERNGFSEEFVVLVCDRQAGGIFLWVQFIQLPKTQDGQISSPLFKHGIGKLFQSDFVLQLDPGLYRSLEITIQVLNLRVGIESERVAALGARGDIRQRLGVIAGEQRLP